MALDCKDIYNIIMSRVHIAQPVRVTHNYSLLGMGILNERVNALDHISGLMCSEFYTSSKSEVLFSDVHI